MSTTAGKRYAEVIKSTSKGKKDRKARAAAFADYIKSLKGEDKKK